MSPVIILSHELWQTTFGGQPNLGQTIEVANRPREVLGIMVATMIIVAAVACLLQARRASRLDPLRRSGRLGRSEREASQQSVVCRLKRAEFALSSFVGQLI